MLGKKAKDVITGFEGTVTGEVTYLTGCKQLLLTGYAKDGKPAESAWFDVDRVEQLTSDAVVLPTHTHDGCDAPAPIR